MNKRDKQEFFYGVALPMVFVASCVIIAALWCEILIQLFAPIN